MKTLGITGVVGSTLLGLVVAQNAPPATPKPAKLTRAAPQSQGDAAATDEWRESLLERDLAVREQNYEHLLEAAQRDPALRQAIDDWARDEANLDLAWSARLLQRELNARRASPWPGFQAPGDLDFGGDLWTDPQKLMEDFQRRFGSSFGPQGGAALIPPQAGAQSSYESFNLEMGPDGVKCKVTKNVDGQEVTEQYDAATMEELLDAHPELRDKLQARQGNPFDVFGGNRGAWFQLGGPNLWQRFPASPLGDSHTVRTDILGVVAQPLGADETTSLGLEAGLGLRIERVEPGTIAAQLGLQRGQVVTEINGHAIKSRDDITEQMRQRGADGEVQVIVVDRWGQKRTRVWRPDSGKRI